MANIPEGAGGSFATGGARKLPPRPTATRLSVWVLLLALMGAFYGPGLWQTSKTPYRTDFAKLHQSAIYLLEGQDIYDRVSPAQLGTPAAEAVSSLAVVHPNLNPPFLTLLLAPLGLLDFQGAYLIWSLLSLAFLFFAAASLSTAFSQGKEGGIPLPWLLIPLLFHFPTWNGILLGQVTFLLLLPLAMSWVWARGNQDRKAGVALALALSIKPFVGLFFIPFLVLARWRILGWFLGAFLAFLGLSLLFAGPDSHLRYLQVLGEVDWFSTIGNASFTGFFTRIFGGAENTPWIEAPHLAFGLAHAFSLAGVAILVWRLRQDGGLAPATRIDRAYATCIPLMLLISPLGWHYYFPALLIPVMIVFHSTEAAPGRWKYLSATAAAWLLSAFPHEMTPSAQVNAPYLWFTVAGSYFYALLILTAVALLLPSRSRPSP